MSGKTVDYLRRLTTPREVEDSPRLRLAVWASVSISLIALALQGVASSALIAASVLLVSVGFYLSWRRRYKPNRLGKALILVLTLVALVSFLRQMMVQPYDPRIPLAELFVWVQILHSYDLPRRKDLLLSLVSSLILLALAASYSLSASFGWVILAWLAAALASLYFAQLSRLRDLSSRPDRASLAQPSPKRLFLMLAMFLVCISVAGLAVGAFMPRLSVSYMQTLPFSLRKAFFSSEGFRFSNPGYPDLPLKPPENALNVNPEAYFGFGPFLDLRARGTLIDLPVMKVRSSEPAYWSGLTFWKYNGYSWLASDEEPAELRTTTQPFTIDYRSGESHRTFHNIVQTFYIESEQPSVIFGAYRPDLLYFPSDFIYFDESGLKSPFSLSNGLVYSVVSKSVVSKELIESSRLEAREDLFSQYLTLPALPERVQLLADEITPEGASPYARAVAIEDFLRSEYEYSLDIPALPSGEDAVDYFLFEEKRGYCEHFASAYAVLCRLAGIPSRVVTGYSTGDYNPFTGLYEVSLGDAHAWVEIYLEGIGWVTREPTPGFTVPQPDQGSGALWIFGDFFAWIGRGLSVLIPAPLRSALKSGLSAVVAGASALASGFLYSVREAPWLLLLLLVILLFPLFLRATGRFRNRRAPPQLDADGPVAAMRDFLSALDSFGLERDPSLTAGEYLGEVMTLLPGLDLSGELSLFERARYGGKALREEEFDSLNRGLTGALAQIRARLKPRRGRRRARSSGSGA